MFLLYILQIFFFFFFLIFIYLFIYLWLHWVFVSVWGLSLVVASGGHSSSPSDLFLIREITLLMVIEIPMCSTLVPSLSLLGDNHYHKFGLYLLVYESIIKKKKNCGKFPGGPMIRTWCFHCCGPGSIPGQGTKILQAAQSGQNKQKTKQKQKPQQNKLWLIHI